MQAVGLAVVCASPQKQSREENYHVTGLQGPAAERGSAPLSHWAASLIQPPFYGYFVPFSTCKQLAFIWPVFGVIFV